MESMTQNLPKPKEGTLTKQVERVTAQVPSMAYLTLAVGSVALSASVAVFSSKKSLANFIGLWAPTFLLIGIYNKLVKIHPTEDAVAV